MPQNLGLITCEHGGRAADAPVIAEPAAAPAPRTVEEVEAQDATEAARTAQHRAVAVDVRRVAVRLLLEASREQLTIVPQRFESASVQTNLARHLETLQLFFSTDGGLARLECALQHNRAQVNLGKGERTQILFFVTRETIAVCRTPPDCPPRADKFGGIERLGPVNRDDSRLSDDDPRAVTQEGGELLTRSRHVTHDSVLQSRAIKIDGGPVSVRGKSRHDCVGLVESDFPHCRLHSEMSAYYWSHVMRDLSKRPTVFYRRI